MLDDQIRECVECHHAYRREGIEHLQARARLLRLRMTEEEVNDLVQDILEAELRVYRMIHGRVPMGTCPKCLPIVSARIDARRYPEPA